MHIGKLYKNERKKMTTIPGKYESICILMVVIHSFRKKRNYKVLTFE